MRTIRVHVGNMDTMLTNIVADLLFGQSGIEIVGRSPRGIDALRGARADRADLLLIQLGYDDPLGHLAAIFAEPPLNILGIANDGRNSTLVRLARKSLPLDSQGSETLSATIRAAADGFG